MNCYNTCMDVKGEDRVLTLSEAGALIELSPRTLYLQVRRGKLAAEKHGGVLLVRESEVRRYERETKGRYGFAAQTHPLHDAPRGGGRRRKPLAEQQPESD